MTRNFASLVLFCVMFLVAPTVASAITIPTVPVGNLGNANDPSTGNLYGSVSYDYRIGTTEVTNAQYVEFLNTKAASDPLALYNTAMGSNARGGITQSGVSGSYTYAAKTEMGNKPVNFVSWYDSIRFANWLNNGQGASDTETGAYTLLGGTPTPSDGLSITRNSGATWFLTSENEWYKAAYHQSTAQGGDTDNYWIYPTSSNTAPTVATANAVGDISNPGTNVANYSFGADWNAQNGNVTTVGSAGPLSDSYYGTSDQGGNVWEWNEALISGSWRALRGGSFNSTAEYLRPSVRGSYVPTLEDGTVGFRVATVPEPSTAVLAIVGLAAVLLYRARKRLPATSVVATTILGLCLGFSNSASAVTIPTVPVGNLGNAHDPATGSLYGGVAYNYRIGTTEVTVGQYSDFLNAVAATDTYGLYHTDMAAASVIAGIARSGVSGSYSYNVIGSPNKPVTYVSWGDATRFSNWLHNGQPTGPQNASTTEDGAYALNGANTNAALNAITRNAGAEWVIPTENEWYKAAYHQNDGATSNYWQYPTSTNSTPYSDQPPGSDAPTPSNTANIYFNDAVTNGYNDGFAATGSPSFSVGQNYLTDVGAYSLSASPYGTFDQGGNVFEWNETLIFGLYRGLRGGSWSDSWPYPQSSVRDYLGGPTEENALIGFRVASVPEPSSVVLAAVGLGSLAVVVTRRRRHRWA